MQHPLLSVPRRQQFRVVDTGITIVKLSELKAEDWSADREVSVNLAALEIVKQPFTRKAALTPSTVEDQQVNTQNTGGNFKKTLN